MRRFRNGDVKACRRARGRVRIGTGEAIRGAKEEPMASWRRTGRSVPWIVGGSIVVAFGVRCGTASAFCREITALTPPSFDPAISPTGCWAGDGGPLNEVYRQNPRITYILPQ